MNPRPHFAAGAKGLRRRAEAQLRGQNAKRVSKTGDLKSGPDPRRLLHELQVHQVEVELQNAELLEARDRMEASLERYTDLYDFAPVGYFSLDEQGRILEANLTGATLLGVERSRLIHGRLSGFVDSKSQPIFRTFLERIFAGDGKQACEANVLKGDGGSFWANLCGTSACAVHGPRKSCRVAISDITPLRQAEESRRRLETLAIANEELKDEIIRRQAVEEALKKSQHQQTLLLQQSRRMQERLRRLSHRILQAQEEERKRISRELHDEIAQILVGINVQLETLARQINPRDFKQEIARTQRLVERSVNIVHKFARELRPTLLDDLGLIATLHSLVKDFTKRTGIRVRFTAFAGVEQLNITRRTVLYRVAQSALTNVAQHARASCVKVDIRQLPEAVCMEIADNGKAFEVDLVLHPRRNKRLGLVGMRERVEMVGGAFSVESTPTRGTTIRTLIPLGNRKLPELSSGA